MDSPGREPRILRHIIARSPWREPRIWRYISTVPLASAPGTGVEYQREAAERRQTRVLRDSPYALIAANWQYPSFGISACISTLASTSRSRWSTSHAVVQACRHGSESAISSPHLSFSCS